MSKFFTGLVTGIVIGIIFAPDKGSETRRRISRTGTDVKKTFSDFIDGLSEGFDTVKEGVNNLTGKNKPAYPGDTDNTWPPA